MNRATGFHGKAEKDTRSVQRVLRPSPRGSTSWSAMAASEKRKPPSGVRPASMSTLFRYALSPLSDESGSSNVTSGA